MIFLALMDGEQQSEFTNSIANVQPRAGTKFNAWDGYIEGVVMELDEPRRIVQSWRASDFPQAHPSSRVQIDLSQSEDGGTTLELRHTGLPADMTEGYDQGWHQYYWTPLRAWLKTRST